MGNYSIDFETEFLNLKLSLCKRFNNNIDQCFQEQEFVKTLEPEQYTFKIHQKCYKCNKAF